MKSQTAPNLSSDVFSKLKQRIIRWEYPPGHRFTEEGLCEEFGVSRSPVREALRMLVENDLVDKEPHRGYSVKQPDINEIDEYYDVRLALELFVVEDLARRGMPADEWERLYQTWQNVLQGLPAIDDDIAEKDEDFHETLAVSTGNHVLTQLLRSIDERLHFIRMTDITTTERLQATCNQHLHILECIKERLPDCARQALQENVEEGRKSVELAVKEALARAYLGQASSARFSVHPNP